jgi:hypothetical protein
MLCAVCTSMFEGSEEIGDHHRTPLDFEQAAKEGCAICAPMLQKLTKNGYKTGRPWSSNEYDMKFCFSKGKMASSYELELHSKAWTDFIYLIPAEPKASQNGGMRDENLLSSTRESIPLAKE